MTWTRRPAWIPTDSKIRELRDDGSWTRWRPAASARFRPGMRAIQVRLDRVQR